MVVSRFWCLMKVMILFSFWLVFWLLNMNGLLLCMCWVFWFIMLREVLISGVRLILLIISRFDL